MDYDHDFWTIQAMMKYGGSFVKSLAAMMSHADRKNMAKIKATWPEYVDEYHEKGQVMRFEVCPFGECDGSGEVEAMEQVYSGEPHMAPIGTRPCRCKTE